MASGSVISLASIVQNGTAANGDLFAGDYGLNCAGPVLINATSGPSGANSAFALYSSGPIYAPSMTTSGLTANSVTSNSVTSNSLTVSGSINSSGLNINVGDEINLGGGTYITSQSGGAPNIVFDIAGAVAAFIISAASVNCNVPFSVGTITNGSLSASPPSDASTSSQKTIVIAGWRVTWGLTSASNESGDGTLGFSPAFSQSPCVIMTANGNRDQRNAISVEQISSVDCDFHTGLNGQTAFFIAIGAA
jgi:hypothetical protein